MNTNEANDGMHAATTSRHAIVDAGLGPGGAGEAELRRIGEAYEECVGADERIRVEVLQAPDGRYAYRAQCGYVACDGPMRDTTIGAERFSTEAEARAAGIVKARQLAGVDVPEA